MATARHPGPIYCVVYDADCSRDSVAADPRSSRIFYFAPTPRVCERLKLYECPRSDTAGRFPPAERRPRVP